MTRVTDEVAVYLETGKKRTIAGALEWPGWCRVGGDEASALGLLLSYGERYRAAIAGSGVDFTPPATVEALVVRERLDGGSATDFGVPGMAPAYDREPLDDDALTRLERLLGACWRTFDATVAAARGKQLRKGPLGGGRDLDKIVEHVLGADAGYLTSLGWKKPSAADDPAALRKAVGEGLRASIRGEIPAKGPRGGTRWSAAYFVRRSAWHVLDHTWEIEDRVE